MANFWERVDKELEYLGKTRKSLASEVGFNLGNIGKGIQLGSIPSAETAVKIAQVLDVSVEYLVNGTEPVKNPTDKQTEQKHYNESLLQIFFP